MRPDTHPDEWRPSADDGPVELVVDGELFLLEVQAGGGSHCTWVSGPNSGYGFSSGATRVAWKTESGLPPAPLPVPLPSIADHRRSIREFLDEIDPETGYLAD